MEPSELYTTGVSDENLERISIKPLLYLASLFSLVFFLVTFIPYIIFRLHLFPFFTFNFSYIFTYLILFLLIIIALILYYKHKSLHMEEISRYVTILGAHPTWLINRTGNRYIDWYGLGIGVCLSVISLIVSKAIWFFPGLLFITLSFLFALLLGSSKKWKLKRR